MLHKHLAIERLKRLGGGGASTRLCTPPAAIAPAAVMPLTLTGVALPAG
jgi:hypothetical protein